jgi:putative flavoprotein involved in K+ transport
VAPVGRRHRCERWLRRRRAPDDRRWHPGARAGPRCARRQVDGPRSANDVLDEADEAFAGFQAAARELAAASPDCDLAEEEEEEEEEAIVSAALPATVADIDCLDLHRENIAAIIFAAGYDYDDGWLHAPALDVQGRPLQQRGSTPVPGLYFLGLHGMHTFKSGLFSGVARDAEYLAEHMAPMTGP